MHFSSFQLVGAVAAQCRVNSKNQAVTSDADIKFRGFTLSPAVKWQTGEKGVALAHKFQAGTLKGSYAVDRKIAGLEYNFKPYKVTHCTTPELADCTGTRRFRPRKQSIEAIPIPQDSASSDTAKIEEH